MYIINPMTKTFFFYDLETSGLNARSDRIMQFAGQRTDASLKPIGEPMNCLIKLTEDILPSPEALMVTGITPQKTIQEGYSEAEFVQIISKEVFTPETTVIGYNNIRFDDEFIRFLMWRNFYDPYEWSYKDGRSRWDMLDVVRITRALRPEGIEWPFDDKGEPTNRLELLTKSNNLNHHKAHDAMSDVEALIDVTRLILSKQPKLFEYLFKMRDKKEVKKLVNLDEKRPFVYSSGRYESKYNKTTVAFPLTAGRNGNVMVYDLRYDPTPFLNMNSKELASAMFASREQRQELNFVQIPVKELQYNRSPAIAPLGVLEQGDGWNKISLNQDIISKHSKILLSNLSFAENVRSAIESRDEFAKSPDAEEQLYDSFVPDADKIRVEAVRKADANKLADLHPNFIDERLNSLLLRYKARNFPASLSEQESKTWEAWRISKLQSRLKYFSETLQKLSQEVTDDNKAFVLQELQLWAENILPTE